MNKKFKAWDIQKKQWIDEDLFVIDSKGNVLTRKNLDSPYEKSELIKLVQFSHLYSDNGQELFEGDLCAHTTRRETDSQVIAFRAINQVTFNENKGRFEQLTVKTESIDTETARTSGILKIGNIYENYLLTI